MKISALAWVILAGQLAACQAATPTASPQVSTPTTTVPPTAPSTPTFTSGVTETAQPTALPVAFVWKIAGDPNSLKAPVGVTIDQKGDIYVMDVGNSRVQKFDSNGNFILMWGSPGNGDGQFTITLPDEGRLGVDSLGNVFVVDTNNNRIQKFDSVGKFLTKWGTKGDGEGQFQEASDIAIDRQDNIYVGDYQSSNVQKFDTNGNFLLRWKSPGNIYSVAIDPDGNILVADEAGRLRKFDGSGILVSEIKPKPVDNIPVELWNIAIDHQGNIYIADYSGFRIVKLDSRGEFLTTWRGSNTGAVPFESLEDIAVEEQGNIFITDSANNLVLKFRQPGFRP
jgi:tripartite motif-containing protein 71